MSIWMVYLWTRLDYIWGVSMFLFIAFAFLSGGCLAAYAEYDDEDAFKWAKRAIAVSFIFLLLFVAIPKKKDAAMIYVIPKMTNSDTFKELSKETPEITKLALEALKETLQGMTKESKQ